MAQENRHTIMKLGKKQQQMAKDAINAYGQRALEAKENLFSALECILLLCFKLPYFSAFNVLLYICF